MGAEATGRRFMIIADRSASMNGAKFDRVIAEIAKTIKGLKPSAKFYVIFYDYLALPCPAKPGYRGQVTLPLSSGGWKTWVQAAGHSLSRPSRSPFPRFIPAPTRFSS